MALNENSGGLPATMLVGPTSGMPAYAGNQGLLGGDGIWFIVLFIILLAGNWNNNGNGGGNMNPVYYGEAYAQRGFDQAAVMAGLNSIQAILYSGFGDVQNSLCSGFAGVTAAVNGGVNVLQQQMFANQIADMQAHNAMQAQFAQGCCDNKVQGMQNTQYIVDAVKGGDQMIMDKLCQLELDTYKTQLAQAQRENVSLQNQLNMATLRESQTAQNAFIQQGFTNEIDALYNRLNNCPVNTVPVYGKTPIFNCNNGNSGCGCGCAA